VTKLKKVFGKDNMKDFNNQIARGWIFPELPDCRQSWEQRYGGKWNWRRARLDGLDGLGGSIPGPQLCLGLET